MPWKFSEETYETIFETLRAQFLILLREISYGSEILSTDTKSSIISALGALHKRLKSPDLAFFLSYLLWHKLSIFGCVQLFYLSQRLETWSVDMVETPPYLYKLWEQHLSAFYKYLKGRIFTGINFREFFFGHFAGIILYNYQK